MHSSDKEGAQITFQILFDNRIIIISFALYFRQIGLFYQKNSPRIFSLTHVLFKIYSTKSGKRTNNREELDTLSWLDNNSIQTLIIIESWKLFLFFQWKSYKLFHLFGLVFSPSSSCLLFPCWSVSNLYFRKVHTQLGLPKTCWPYLSILIYLFSGIKFWNLHAKTTT